MKYLIVIACLFIFGCGTNWKVEKHPETDKERDSVAKHEKEILSKIPSTLSGHDQDWDDVIIAAHNIAVQTYCKDRLYEYEWSCLVRTGKIKEIVE